MKNCPTGRVLSMSLALLSLSACYRVNISQEGPGLSYEISLTAFQAIPMAKWVADAGRYYTDRRVVVYDGMCMRGVYGVRVMDTMSQTELEDFIVCREDRTFSFSYEVPADGNYTFTFQGLDRMMRIQGEPVASNIGVQTIPPAPPVITTNGGADFHSPTAEVNVDGTVGAGVRRILVFGQDGTMDFAADTFNFDFLTTLDHGETATMLFVAVNHLGRRSSPTQIIVSYMATLHLRRQIFSALGTDNPAVNSPGGFRMKKVTLTHDVLPWNEQNSQSGNMKIKMGLPQITEETP